LLGQFLYGIPTVPEDSLFTVEEGYGTLTGSRILISGVHGHQSRRCPQFVYIDGNFILSTFDYGEFIPLPPIFQYRFFRHYSINWVNINGMGNLRKSRAINN